MGDDEAREFAAARNALVVAAAGCGKTDLIARAVRCDERGRQLVLTHTHAGVRVLRERLLKTYGVPAKRFVVDTIDGWALRYARSYPALSGLGNQGPPAAAWPDIRQAARKALERLAIRDVVANSYTGLYVDEYQDCAGSQHALICTLSEILPARIVGDPLQGIFDFEDQPPAEMLLFERPDPRPDWRSDVEGCFPRLRELQTPYRWRTENPELGEWLGDVRTRLEGGTEINLLEGPIDWKRVDDPNQRYIPATNACRSVATRQGERIVVIRRLPNHCFQLGKKLGGQYRCAERLDCPDLFKWVHRLEELCGPERANAIIELARCCITSTPDVLRSLQKAFAAGQEPGPHRAKKHPELKQALLAVARDDDPTLVATALDRVEEVGGANRFHRYELWDAVRQTFATHDPCADGALRDTAWSVRDRARHYGRRLSRCTIGTTWLVKGLQFDHCIVIDADDDGFDAKNLYVAMTRASKSLTILAASPRLQKPRALQSG